MLRHLLDTNICIDVIKRRPQELLDTFNHHAGQMAISAITFSKLIIRGGLLGSIRQRG
jgi:tRNA(fMet)-specific endonuclease VapC